MGLGKGTGGGLGMVIRMPQGSGSARARPKAGRANATRHMDKHRKTIRDLRRGLGVVTGWDTNAPIKSDFGVVIERRSRAEQGVCDTPHRRRSRCFGTPPGGAGSLDQRHATPLRNRLMCRNRTGCVVGRCQLKGVRMARQATDRRLCPDCMASGATPARQLRAGLRAPADTRSSASPQ